MPTTINIPSHVERHCAPCEFHKLTASLHVRIGEGGYRQYACTHPEAFERGPTPSDPPKARLAGKIDALLKREGRDIGKTELQPNWCPLRRNPPLRVVKA